jgi:uncharacterized protein (TIGR03435 family)
MLAHLADVSIRSLVLVIPAVLVLSLVQRTRTAALQHAVWTAVVCGMLALFAFGQALPRLPLRVLDRPVTQTAAPATAATPLVINGLSISQPAAGKTPLPIDWRTTILYIWSVVAFLFLARFAMGMFLAGRFFSNAQPTPDRGVYESDRVSVPVTVGWLCPRILLPLEWHAWDSDKLNAVLAHEGAHVRRRDGLISALAGINRSIFWFHPLAWILERKLALLADQACDEASVAILGDRKGYARLLLEMAQMVDRSQGRLRRHALTMAAGSHIGKRIEAILDESRTFSQGLSRTAKISLLLCGVPLVLAAGAVEVDRLPSTLRLDLPHWAAPTPPPVHIAQVQAAPAPTALPPAPTPKFDSVSVKPCEQGNGAGHVGRGGAGGGRGIPMPPPGELLVNCMTVWEMVGHAVTASAPLLNDFGGPFEPQRVTGGPAWIYSDYYTINAKSSDPVANVPGPTGGADFKLLSGSMLLNVLETSFQLKFRRVTQDVPVYALMVANSGFKLQPAQPGDCIPHEPSTPLRLPKNPAPDEKPYCITHGGWDGPNWNVEAHSQTLTNLSNMLGGMAEDRPVLDKTGITGPYTYNLKFAHDANAPGSFPPGMNPFAIVPADIPVAPSIATALEQQLGLTIVSDTGSRETVVIDSAARPSQN